MIIILPPLIDPRFYSVAVQCFGIIGSCLKQFYIITKTTPRSQYFAIRFDHHTIQTHHSTFLHYYSEPCRTPIRPIRPILPPPPAGHSAEWTAPPMATRNRPPDVSSSHGPPPRGGPLEPFPLTVGQRSSSGSPPPPERSKLHSK